MHVDRIQNIARECILEGKSIPAGIVGEVKWLDLSHSRVTDKMLLALKPLTALETLNLDGTEITDAGLKYLPTGLKYLFLWRTGVTYEGLLALAPLARLKVLWLRGTPASEAGPLSELERLSSLPPLVEPEKVSLPPLDELEGVSLLVGKITNMNIKITDAGFEVIPPPPCLRVRFSRRLKCPQDTLKAIVSLLKEREEEKKRRAVA